MGNNEPNPGDVSDSNSSSNSLRQRAEEIVRESFRQTPEIMEALSPEAARKLIHELRVHQIELEMQNDELRRTQEDLEFSRVRYFDLFDLAPVGYLMINDKGLIEEANLTIATMLGVARESLVRQSLTHFIIPEDQDTYYLHIKQLVATGASGACELRLVSKGGGQFWVRVEAAMVLDANDITLFHEVLSDITERKQAEETLRRNSEIQSVLRAIAEAAVLAPSMGELYQTVHCLVGRVLPVNLFHIYLLDEAAGEFVAPFRADDLNFIPERRPIGKGITEYIMRMGRPVHVTPAEMDHMREIGEYTLANSQIRHYLGAPLMDSQGKPFGVMSLISLEETQPFQPEDIEVLSIIAAQVSQAIERKRLEKELQYRATSDGLTGIFTQSHFLSRADEELQRIHRYGGTCSLLMVDIDHFNLLNDNFGQAEVDAIWQRVTTFCEEVTRSTDLMGRMDGAEFAVLLLKSGSSEANQIADRLRKSIQEKVFGKEDGVKLLIGVSIGVAELQSESESISELMVRAEKSSVSCPDRREKQGRRRE